MLVVLNKALVHVLGHYGPADLRVLVTQRKRHQSALLERRIEDAWSVRQAEAEGRLFDSELARLVAHGVLPNQLALFIGRTTFREFVGTNLEAPIDPSLHESLGEDYFANPLGVSAAVVSKDGALLLARRSNAVVEARGEWDLPGGHVPFVEAQGCRPFVTAADEIAQELGLVERDIEELACIGLVENGVTHKPELIFVCRVRDKAKKLLKRVQSHGDAEHDEFLCVPATKSDLLDLLRERGNELTPVAAGGIAIFVS